MSSKTVLTGGTGIARTGGWQNLAGAMKDRVKRWWERRHIFVGGDVLVVGTMLAMLLVAPNRAFSQPEIDANSEDAVATELSGLGRQGDTILRARAQTLEILQGENACSGWFRESDPDAVGVFRSIHFELEPNGTDTIYGQWDFEHGMQYKHPWGARSTENSGRDAIVILNANGPFFKRASYLMQKSPGAMVAHPVGNLSLYIATFGGNTAEAQITILLHELGHVIGRLPEDNDSFDGRSSRNTQEVLRHCKAETKAAAHNTLRASN